MKRMVHLFDNTYVDPDEVESIEPSTERPEGGGEMKIIPPRYRLRVKMKSGMTYRSQTSFPMERWQEEVATLLIKIAPAPARNTHPLLPGGRIG